MQSLTVWLVYATRIVTEWSFIILNFKDEFLVSYWLFSVCDHKVGCHEGLGLLRFRANATVFFSYRYTGKMYGSLLSNLGSL